MFPSRCYLTGTDTDVGKTVSAAALCQAHGLDYVKPVQSGTPADSDVVRDLTNVRVWPETYRFSAPVSPHAAAEADGVDIDLQAVTLPDTPRLLVEGAGGWMVPYRTSPLTWQAELVRHLALPVVVVARTGLGTLNHTFLTLRAIRDDGLEVAGLVLVGPHHDRNEADLARWGAPVLARLPRVADPQAQFGVLVQAARHPDGARAR